jgi:hypothetical protein
LNEVNGGSEDPAFGGSQLSSRAIGGPGKRTIGGPGKLSSNLKYNGNNVVQWRGNNILVVIGSHRSHTGLKTQRSGSSSELSTLFERGKRGEQRSCYWGFATIFANYRLAGQTIGHIKWQQHCWELKVFLDYSYASFKGSN